MHTQTVTAPTQVKPWTQRPGLILALVAWHVVTCLCISVAVAGWFSLYAH